MIALDRVTKRYGDRVVVDDLLLTIEAGRLTALIGPSGCGKSTTLRMINGLIAPDTGTVAIDGRNIAEMDPQALRRGIGYAIQAGGLFPHWTVARNIATVPSLLGWPKPQIAARVETLMRLLGLPPEYAHERPARLSGGQQQRVGVARALAADAPVLLMDEPFSALDPITRTALQTDLRRIQRDTGKTIVFVTHDIDEALLLADRIVIMERGRLAQEGTPAEVLQHPASDFVRNFMGGRPGSLRLLVVRKVRDRLHADAATGAPEIDAEESLLQALSAMLAARAETLAVTQQGRIVGSIRLGDIVA